MQAGMLGVVPIEIRSEQVFRTGVARAGFEDAVHLCGMSIEFFFFEERPHGLKGEAAIEALGFIFQRAVVVPEFEMQAVTHLTFRGPIGSVF